MIAANNPQLKSWINVPHGHDFPIQNLPFGIVKNSQQKFHAAVPIGDYIIDLQALAESGLLANTGADASVFSTKTLNNFIQLGKTVTSAVRNRLSELLSADNAELRDNEALKAKVLLPYKSVSPQLPVAIGDYTDFYSSIDHATNMGKMFRDPANALLPNWKHIPVGYHGRSSSIVVSGTPIHRPKGQTKAAIAEVPSFGPTKMLDFELETGFIVGKSTQLGSSITTEQATDHIFGMVLFNDWSARDIQSWEYVPLGPFLAKNFGSIASPWIVTMDALEPFRVKGYEQTPEVLPYLKYSGDKNIDITLEVFIAPEGKKPTLVSSSNYKYMYWTMEQQLTHHTVNGCNVNVGDLMASGTISGPHEGSYGSMMEIAWKGTKPVQLEEGGERSFIQDFDTVIIKGYAQKDGVRIGFGECSSKILPTL